MRKVKTLLEHAAWIKKAQQSEAYKTRARARKLYGADNNLVLAYEAGYRAGRKAGRAMKS